MAAIRQLARNPFGRYDIVSQQTSKHGKCRECGRPGVTRRYGRWSDGGTYTWSIGDFCSKQCCESHWGAQL